MEVNADVANVGNCGEWERLGKEARLSSQNAAYAGPATAD
jgi:hypothetical protein